MNLISVSMVGFTVLNNRTETYFTLIDLKFGNIYLADDYPLGIISGANKDPALLGKWSCSSIGPMLSHVLQTLMLTNVWPMRFYILSKDWPICDETMTHNVSPMYDH